MERAGLGAIQPGRLYGNDQFTNVVLAARQRYLADIMAIVGAGNLRFLVVPALADTVTSTDLSPNARTVTHNATIAARLTAQGFGYGVSENGTDQYATIPDAADLSFGNGLVDLPFSPIVLANITNTAAQRDLLTKRSTGAGNREWSFHIASTDVMSLAVTDESAGVSASRSTDADPGAAAIKLLGATYNGAGGAAAADGITMYVNGASVASTASNNASYVAMESLATNVGLGVRADGTPANFFSGSLYMAMLVQAALTAAQHLAIKNRTNDFFGLSL